MTLIADAAPLRRFLTHAAQRVRMIALVEGAAAGLFVAFALALLGVPQRGTLLSALLVALLCAVIGAVARLAMTSAARANVAQLVERRAPSCRNLVITADELVQERGPGTDSGRASAPPLVSALVCREALRVVRTLDLRALFPARKALIALGTGAALVALSAARDAEPLRAASNAVRSVIAPNVARIDELNITITPPSYSDRPELSVRDTSRIEALAGSRIALHVRGLADSLLVETLRGAQRIAPTSTGEFRINLPADVDGFISLVPLRVNGAAGSARLLGVTVIPDAPPRVRIVTPGRDLFLRDSLAVIDLTVESDDDLGLATLQLRYTRVAGSGERFTFDEGTVPLTITRTNARAWKGSGRLSLAALKLTPGDMVVYRAVATDRRPGSPTTESDAFIAEIIAPGGDAAAGFAIDPEQERYAVSQAMVVLKTERLIARMGSMPADSVLAASMELAVEQRKVRAEFVFMMGGELLDERGHEGHLDDLGEEAEAEAEDDILAGRLENQGRAALMRAIRSMSRASTALNVAQLTDALASEKSALAQLELAFSRARIILRALAEREALDLTRRLSGDLGDARTSQRAVATPEADARTAALRTALSELAMIAGDASAIDTQRAALDLLAQQLLRTDPSFEPLQSVSTLVASAAAGSDRDARVQLERAVTALAEILRASLPAARPSAPSLDVARLRGALKDARHRSPAATAPGSSR